TGFGTDHGETENPVVTPSDKSLHEPLRFVGRLRPQDSARRQSRDPLRAPPVREVCRLVESLRGRVTPKAALGAVYLLAWAAFVPGNDQSAGKRRSTRVRYGVRPRAARRRAPPRPRPRALRPSCATADPGREIDARHAAQRPPNRLPLAVGTACAIHFFV